MTRNNENLDSNELIELAKKGQKQAFGILVKRHYGTVMYYLLGFGVKKSDAEDITQEAFINAFRKIDQFRTSGSFVGWLLRIARNQHIDKLRKEKKFDTTGSELDLLNLPDDRTPEAQVVSDAAVDDLYSGLKAQEKVLLDLRIFQQLPFVEIAELLGSSEGNARLVFHRLIVKLRAKFKS
ncbi:MAG: RNA polymerase sigma-E factor [uncultured bacterium]|nr:MAG: RNA polymerase sigma-E factor [uncultured bacterium]